MRLSNLVCMMVEQAIQNLPILQVEKDALDYEIISGKTQVPPPAQGFITVYKVQLFAPAVGSDHTTNDQDIIIMDPYSDQDTYDRAVFVAYEEIVAEQEAAKQTEVPDELQQPGAQQAVTAAMNDMVANRSKSGLILPGR